MTKHKACSEHEAFEKHSGDSSVWPRLSTTDPSQIFPSKVNFIPWVLTAHGQMLKIQKRSEGKGGEYMKTLMLQQMMCFPHYF